MILIRKIYLFLGAVFFCTWFLACSSASPADASSVTVKYRSDIHKQTITVEWERDTNAISYIVEIRKDNQPIQKAIVQQSSVQQYRKEIALPAGDYTVQISAQRAAGAPVVLGTSNLVTVRTAATAPTQVASFTAATGTDAMTEIKLSWTAPANMGKNDDGSVATISSYTVYYKASSDASPKLSIGGVGVESVGAGISTSHTITGLTSNTRYAFVVLAKNSAGLASPNSSVETKKTATRIDKPGVIRGLSLATTEGPKANSITLSFTPPDYTGKNVAGKAAQIKFYVVVYKQSDLDISIDANTADLVRKEFALESQTLKNVVRIDYLQSDKKYYFALLAKNSFDQEGEYSDTFSAKTLSDIRANITSTVYSTTTYGEYKGHLITDLSSIPKVSELYFVDTKVGEAEALKNAANVLLYARGGPESVPLEDEGFSFTDLYGKFTDKSKWAIIQVSQSQIEDPDHGKDQEITMSEAVIETAKSAAMLFKVAKYFHEVEKKKVHILTHSFGSFIVPKTMIDYRYEDYVEKVLVLAGRLAMNKEIYTSFAEGKLRGFKADNEGLFRAIDDNVQHVNLEYVQQMIAGGFELPAGYTAEQFSNIRRSYAKLQASLGQYKYIELFKKFKVPLSKVMFASGKKDAPVGYYSQAEMDFLNSVGAGLHLSEVGHSTIDAKDGVGGKDIPAYVKFLEGTKKKE